MTIEDTGKLVVKIAALWPRFEINERATVPAWAEIFTDVDFSDAVEAVRLFGKTASHSFPPSAPEIYALVKNVQRNRALAKQCDEQNERLAIEAKESRPTMAPEERKAWMRQLMIKAGFA